MKFKPKLLPKFTGERRNFSLKFLASLNPDYTTTIKSEGKSKLKIIKFAFFTLYLVQCIVTWIFLQFYNKKM